MSEPREHAPLVKGERHGIGAVPQYAQFRVPFLSPTERPRAKAVGGQYDSGKETVMIELTEQQQQSVKNGEVIRVAVPEIGEDVVLLRATAYETIRALLEDQREQQAVLRYSMKQAAKAAQENPY